MKQQLIDQIEEDFSEIVTKPKKHKNPIDVTRFFNNIDEGWQYWLDEYADNGDREDEELER